LHSLELWYLNWTLIWIHAQSPYASRRNFTSLCEVLWQDPSDISLLSQLSINPVFVCLLPFSQKHRTFTIEPPICSLQAYQVPACQKWYLIKRVKGNPAPTWSEFQSCVKLHDWKGAQLNDLWFSCYRITDKNYIFMLMQSNYTAYKKYYAKNSSMFSVEVPICSLV